MSNDAQDSGLIDLFAAHRAGQESLRAQAERGSNLPSSPPPAVALDAAPFASIASFAPARARLKWIAGGAGALALLGVIIGFAASGGESAKVAAAAAAAPPPVTVMAREPAPAEVAPAVPSVAPAVAHAAMPEPEPVATKHTSTKRRGGGRGKGTSSGGVKLVKVSSGGVETSSARGHK